MDYKTFETLRSYCRTDLAAYIDTPAGEAACFLLESLHGPVGELQHEQETAMRLFQCKDLTPREKAAADLLAVISNHRAMTWQREPEPPGGKEPAPALTPEQNASAWEQTRLAVRKYSAHIPEREAAVLLEAVQAPETATPAPGGAASNAPAIPKNQRPNLLTPLIEKAQRGETDLFSAAVIWPKLCDMAERKTTPFIGKTESGLQWIDANDSPQFLTKNALGDRLRRQKNPR